MGKIPENDSKGKSRAVVPIELSVRTGPLRSDRLSNEGQTVLTLPNQSLRSSDVRTKLELTEETEGEPNKDSKNTKSDDTKIKIINITASSNPNSRSGTTKESGPDRPEDKDRDKPNKEEGEKCNRRKEKKEIEERKKEIVSRIKIIKKKHQKIRDDNKKQQSIKEFTKNVVNVDSPVGDQNPSYKTKLNFNFRDQYNSIHEGSENRKLKLKLKTKETPPKLKQGILNFTTIKLEGKVNKGDYRKILSRTQTGCQIVTESSVTNQPEDSKDSPEEEPVIHKREVQTPSQQWT